jgi:PAS domain S-box-containing protein
MEFSAKADRRLVLMNRVASSIIPAGDAIQPDLKAAFEAIATELAAQIYLHYRTSDVSSDVLSLSVAGGLDLDRLMPLRHLRFGERLCGRVAQTGASLVLDGEQLAADPAAEFLRAAGATCYAGLPLVAHGALHGTMAFASASRPRFSPDEIDLLRMLAGQIATALDRAQLVQRLRDNEMRYRNAVITGRLAAWETDMVTRTRIWTEEGMALFGLDLSDGVGQVGGDNDEYLRALHPDYKHLMAQFHNMADEIDTYPTEYQIVRPDGKVLWVQGRGRVIARTPDGKAARVANIVVDITERKKAQEHIQQLMGELSHRSKNLLAVVQAIAGRTVRTARTLDEFGKSFAERLQGIAASQDLLVQQNWHGGPLAELVRQQLAPYAEAGSARLSIDGPEVVLTSGATQAIGLALTELATNAIKHGAWSVPDGTVTVKWAYGAAGTGAPSLRLSWLEAGGPSVTLPTSKGFGHVVIESMVAQSTGGEVSIEFDPAGLKWTLVMPPSNVVIGD